MVGRRLAPGVLFGAALAALVGCGDVPAGISAVDRVTQVGMGTPQDGLAAPPVSPWTSNWQAPMPPQQAHDTTQLLMIQAACREIFRDCRARGVSLSTCHRRQNHCWSILYRSIAKGGAGGIF